MTVGQALADGARALEAGRPGSPFLDASLLLAKATGRARDSLLASRSDPVDTEAFSVYTSSLKRRLAGEPVAYILGWRDFRHLRFTVDRRVLVPRPETELLVDAILEALPEAVPGTTPRYHDAFAGSGCVGLSVAHERPDVNVSLSDASPEALEVLAINAALSDRSRAGGAVTWSLGSVLSAAKGPLDGISANPPYVSSSFVDGMEAAGSTEPRLALDGGPDGLGLYPLIAAQAFPLLRGGGFLALEIGDEQGVAVSQALLDAGFSDVRVLADLAGQDRVVLGVKP